MMSKIPTPLRVLALPGILVLGFLILWVHRVDISLTQEDKATIQTLLETNNIHIAKPFPTYEDQLEFILGIQDVILDVAPEMKGIKFGSTREPADVVKKKYGLCYDRSRFIEKTLRYGGFEVRHVGLYSTHITKSKWESLLTSRDNSHSLSEVKTSKGWLVVDSNARWVSLDANKLPRRLKEIQRDAHVGKIKWHPDFYPLMNEIYKHPFTWVYGLYSRHGRFYPPYNVIPDINWTEFLLNFLL